MNFLLDSNRRTDLIFFKLAFFLEEYLVSFALSFRKAPLSLVMTSVRRQLKAQKPNEKTKDKRKYLVHVFRIGNDFIPKQLFRTTQEEN